MKKSKKSIKKLDLSFCCECIGREKLPELLVRVIYRPNHMMALEIISYENNMEQRFCNFFTNCRFRSEEYARLVFLVNDFKNAQGYLDNVKRRFNNLMEYVSIHCDVERTMNEMTHRCKCLPEILVNSLNMRGN